MAIELHHLQAQAFDVAGKAIDEISRLRAENDKLKADYDRLLSNTHKERHEYINMVHQRDKKIAEMEESHKMEVEQLLIEIAELKNDYKEACDRLQTANLIKDEQRVKATKLLGCLKYLVMRDLIKDCPEKESAIKIVKEYDNGLV